jgi:hypothetical protein
MATAGKTKVGGEVVVPEAIPTETTEPTAEQAKSLADLNLLLASLITLSVTAASDEQRAALRKAVDAYLSECKATFFSLRLTASADYDKATEGFAKTYETAVKPLREAYEKACEPFAKAYDEACKPFQGLLAGAKEAKDLHDTIVTLLGKRDGYGDLELLPVPKGRVPKAKA